MGLTSNNMNKMKKLFAILALFFCVGTASAQEINFPELVDILINERYDWEDLNAVLDSIHFIGIYTDSTSLANTYAANSYDQWWGWGGTTKYVSNGTSWLPAGGAGGGGAGEAVIPVTTTTSTTPTIGAADITHPKRVARFEFNPASVATVTVNSATAGDVVYMTNISTNTVSFTNGTATIEWCIWRVR